MENEEAKQEGTLCMGFGETMAKVRKGNVL